MSWAADGLDGNGLHLEKDWVNVFKFIALCLRKLSKTMIGLFSLKIHLMSPLTYTYLFLTCGSFNQKMFNAP